MQEQSSINIQILKNDSFAISIKDPSVVSFSAVLRESTADIPFMQSFQGRGKYEHTKFSYSAQTCTLRVVIHKKKVKGNSVVDYADLIWRIWMFSMDRMRQLLKNKFAYGNCVLESVDALSFQFSFELPQMNNRKYYFRYSDIEFNNNIAHYDCTKTLYPCIEYSLVKGQYYKSPRLPFVEEIGPNFKFPQIFNWIQKYFTIGLTLYSIHFYPKLMEDETNREKFEKVNQADSFQNNLVKEVEAKRRQSYRKTYNMTILTTARFMSIYNIAFQLEYGKYNEKTDPNIKITVTLKNNETQIRILFSDQMILKSYYARNASKPFFKDVTYTPNKEISINYKSRLVFEYVMLSLELFCYKCIERNFTKQLKDTKIQNIKNETNTISSISLERFEVICSSHFYLLVKVLDNETYEIVHLRTDFTWDKYKAIQAEATKVSQPIRDRTSDSERTQEDRPHIFEQFPCLKDYLNWYINVLNLKDIAKEIAQLCDYCSKKDMSPTIKQLFNQIISGAIRHIRSWDSIIKVKIQTPENTQGCSSRICLKISYYQQFGFPTILLKSSKLTLANSDDDEMKIQIKTEPNTYITTKKISDIMANFNFGDYTDGNK